MTLLKQPNTQPTDISEYIDSMCEELTMALWPQIMTWKEAQAFQWLRTA